jgi:hypothetical protein
VLPAPLAALLVFGVDGINRRSARGDGEHQVPEQLDLPNEVVGQVL